MPSVTANIAVIFQKNPIIPACIFVSNNYANSYRQVATLAQLNCVYNSMRFSDVIVIQ